MMSPTGMYELFSGVGAVHHTDLPLLSKVMASRSILGEASPFLFGCISAWSIGPALSPPTVP